MQKLDLSEQILSVICMVQSAKNLFLNELALNEYNAGIEQQAYTNKMSSKDDWLTRTRNYYFSIDGDFIHQIGLIKNEYCFKAILDFRVTDEITNTNYDELNKFTFSY